MRKKVLGLSLAVLFFGSTAISTFGMTTMTFDGEKVTKVDDNKKKSKSKKSKAKSGDCASECSKSKESCDGKKGADKK